MITFFSRSASNEIGIAFDYNLNTISPMIQQFSGPRLRSILILLGVLGLCDLHCKAAGVTVITHGFQLFSGTVPAWAQRMAMAISVRSETHGGGPATIYEYAPATQTFELWHLERDMTQRGSQGEVILIFNWAEDSDYHAGGFAEAAGEALFVALMRGTRQLDGRPLKFVALPLHFIGHSRGAVVNSEAIKRLAVLGVEVDHVTTLDPHSAHGLDPLQDIFQDARAGVQTWNNVVFADNYYRHDGLDESDFDFNGMVVVGALNHELDEGLLGLDLLPDAEDPGYAAEHSDVHLWYHGTVDWDPMAYDGAFAVPSVFYQTGNPSRTTSGYYFSRIVGGERPTATGEHEPLTSHYWVANGDFAYNTLPQIGNVAGYSYHGGESSFECGLNIALLNAFWTTLRHNRIFVPEMAGGARIAFSTRYTLQSDTPTLVVSGFDQVLTNIEVTAEQDWHEVQVDLSAYQGQTSPIELRLDNVNPGGASIELDNLRIEGTPLRWPNIRLQSLAKASYALGQELSVHWTSTAPSPSTLLDLIWDDDRNPFNGDRGVAQANIDAGAGIASLTIGGLSPGQYYLYARVRAGSQERYDFLREPVTILPTGSSGPFIVTQPINQYIAPGKTGTFSVAASGIASITYQWQRNGTSIPGATEASYTTPSATVSNSGEQYRVIVANPQGEVTSAPAVLTVAGAAFLEWTGAAGDGDWNNRVNWNPTNIPTARDAVRIAIGGNVNMPADAAFALLTLEGGSLVGDFAVSATFTWMGGVLADGTLTIAPEGVMNICGDNPKNLSNRQIASAGTVNWSGMGSVSGGGEAMIENLAGGQILLQSDAWLSSCALTNYGTIRKTGGSGTAVWMGLTFLNLGSVEVESGTINFPTSWMFGIQNIIDSTGGVFSIGESGAVLFTGDLFSVNRFDGVIIGPNITLASGNLAGTQTIRGTFNWAGGAFSDGTLTIEPNGVLNITGDEPRSFASRRIANAGTVNWSGMGSVSGGGEAMIENLAGGQILLQSDAWLSSCALTNYGTIRKTGGSGTAVWMGLTFLNLGAVEVESGTINFAASFWFGNLNIIDSTGGVFSIGESGAVLFTGDLFTMNRFDGVITGPSITLASGEFAGTQTIRGTFNWAGGAFSDGTLTIEPNGVLNITGDEPRSFASRRIANAGTVNWSGMGSVSGGGEAMIENLAGGQILLQSDAGLSSCALTNYGTIRKIGNSGTAQWQAVVLRNLGDFEILSGQVHLGASEFVQEAGRTLLGSATLASDSTLEFRGGVLMGVGAIDASIFNNAEVRPGLSPGVLTINGDYLQSPAGVIEIEIGAIPITEFDRLVVNGSAVLDGALHVKLINAFAPSLGASFGFMTCSARTGMFSSTNGTAIGFGRQFRTDYATTGVTLTVVVGGPPTCYPLGTINGLFHFGWQGEPGVSYQLEASTNLIHWLPVLTTNTPNGVWEYIDADSRTLPHRFYRGL